MGFGCVLFVFFYRIIYHTLFSLCGFQHQKDEMHNLSAA